MKLNASSVSQCPDVMKHWKIMWNQILELIQKNEEGLQTQLCLI